MERLHDARTDLVGIGISEDLKAAELISCVEALERYAACVWADHEFMFSSPAQMVGSHVEFSSWPRCTPAEYADPGCPFTVPVDTEPIRWVRGVDLQAAELTWVPSGMVFLTLEASSQPFVTSSSGCAAHPSLPGAIRRALCEVIERDASSLIWNARLPVHPLDERVLEAPTLRLVETKRARAVESFLFDGTTDLGVPVVLSLDLGPDGEVLLNVSAHPLVTAAAEHCVRETYMHSTASGWAFPGRSRGHLRDADYRLCEAARFLVDAHRSGAARGPANLPGQGDVEWIAAILERLAEKSIGRGYFRTTCQESLRYRRCWSCLTWCSQ